MNAARRVPSERLPRRRRFYRATETIRSAVHLGDQRRPTSCVKLCHFRNFPTGRNSHRLGKGVNRTTLFSKWEKQQDNSRLIGAAD
ncbi:hypothetical protein EYF80_019814 [Liparis tanakae]|uniref:Uncharacterized protein n=1 Tax=Liparis tanakae TaxID=230148 RepID=A0A4Z2HWI1_9TELE|nr:hypothetical protein EYF80_019814 [Liparis tanakae]